MQVAENLGRFDQEIAGKRQFQVRRFFPTWSSVSGGDSPPVPAKGLSENAKTARSWIGLQFSAVLGHFDPK